MRSLRLENSSIICKSVQLVRGCPGFSVMHWKTTEEVSPVEGGRLSLYSVGIDKAVFFACSSLSLSLCRCGHVHVHMHLCLFSVCWDTVQGEITIFNNSSELVVVEWCPLDEVVSFFSPTRAENGATTVIAWNMRFTFIIGMQAKVSKTLQFLLDGKFRLSIHVQGTATVAPSKKKVSPSVVWLRG